MKDILALEENNLIELFSDLSLLEIEKLFNTLDEVGDLTWPI